MKLKNNILILNMLGNLPFLDLDVSAQTFLDESTINVHVAL